MAFDYEKEKQWVEKELETYKIHALTNNGPDYEEIEKEDTAAFERYIKSDYSKSFSAEVLGK